MVEQVLAAHRHLHLVGLVGGVQSGERGKSVFQLMPADLGGGREPWHLGIARVHAERDHLQPPLDRIAVPGIAGIATVQHVADDALVEVVPVLRQPAAVVVEDANGR